MVSKDMIALAKMSEDELDSQKEKIMNNLQNLFNNGKINYQEYEKLRGLIEKDISKTKIEHKKSKLQAQTNEISKELESILSSDVDGVNLIMDEINVLKDFIENETDKVKQQEKNVLDKILNLFDAGKITETEYDNLKNLTQQTILTMKNLRQSENKKDEEIFEENVSDILSNILDEELSSILSEDDYNAVSKDLQALQLIDSSDVDHQNENINDFLQSLYENGKISSNGLDHLKNKVQENIAKAKNALEDYKLHNLNKNIEQELKESLSTNDYESINEEIEILNGLIESNSDISSEQEKNSTICILTKEEKNY